MLHVQSGAAHGCIHPHGARIIAHKLTKHLPMLNSGFPGLGMGPTLRAGHTFFPRTHIPLRRSVLHSELTSLPRVHMPWRQLVSSTAVGCMHDCTAATLAVLPP